MLDTMKENVLNGKYKIDIEYPKKPEGFARAYRDDNGNRQFKDVYVYDESKSVKWNKEHREELVDKYYKDLDACWEASRKKEEEFKTDLINALIEEYKLTDNQANHVYVRAWEDGHSDGLEQVVYDAVDYAEFARDILDNKKYY